MVEVDRWRGRDWSECRSSDEQVFVDRWWCAWSVDSIEIEWFEVCLCGWSWVFERSVWRHDEKDWSDRLLAERLLRVREVLLVGLERWSDRWFVRR